METVIVGARGSRLAQAMVQELINHLSGCPVVQFKARSVMTDGDKDRKTPSTNMSATERREASRLSVSADAPQRWHHRRMSSADGASQ